MVAGGLWGIEVLVGEWCPGSAPCAVTPSCGIELSWYSLVLAVCSWRLTAGFCVGPVMFQLAGPLSVCCLCSPPTPFVLHGWLCHGQPSVPPPSPLWSKFFSHSLFLFCSFAPSSSFVDSFPLGVCLASTIMSNHDRRTPGFVCDPFSSSPPIGCRVVVFFGLIHTSHDP